MLHGLDTTKGCEKGLALNDMSHSDMLTQTGSAVVMECLPYYMTAKETQHSTHSGSVWVNGENTLSSEISSASPLFLHAIGRGRGRGRGGVGRV